MSQLFSDDPLITLLEDTSTTTDNIMAMCSGHKTPCPFEYIRIGPRIFSTEHKKALSEAQRKYHSDPENAEAISKRNALVASKRTFEGMSKASKKIWTPEVRKRKSEHQSSVIGEQNKGRKWFNDGVRNYFRYPHEQQSDWVVGQRQFGKGR